MTRDDSKLRDALRSIQGQLTRGEASTLIDVARLAASADGRMDLGEMGAIAQLSNILYGLAGEVDVPVPSQQLDATALLTIGDKLPSAGGRELAYACAMYIVHTDRKVTQEEDALGSRLAETLFLAPERAQELSQLMASLLPRR